MKYFYKFLILSFAGIGLLLLTPPTFYFTYKLFNSNPDVRLETQKYFEIRHKLGLYDDFDWAEKHFKEYLSLKSKYYDFISWRRIDFKGETINIKNGIRDTFISKEINLGKEFWFFGGSTTWGTGSNDFYTYPSIFSRISNYKSINYGETGWVSRQSLSFLNNLYISKNNDNEKIIIFYDGVNDIMLKCNESFKTLGTSRESFIQDKIDKNKNIFSFEKTFYQLNSMISKAIDRIALRLNISIKSKNQNNNVNYNCGSSANKTKFVGDMIIRTWIQAQKLAKANGDIFVAILQPVTVYGEINYEYLPIEPNNVKYLKNEFKSVYSYIKKNAPIELDYFLDFTNIFDECSNCYIDFSHTGPQGNKVISENLYKNFVKLSLL